MVKILQDIWIIKDGVVVFERTFDKNVDPQLFGGLMSALNSFAEELAKGGLSNFELSQKKFTIIKKGSFLFVADSKPSAKAKKVEKELQNIVQKFFSLYPKEMLETWDGDLGAFTDFENEIEESLDETVKKFEKAFW